MNSITLKAFAKINLTLDVLGKLPNGFHQVEMIMQQISLHDEVFISYEEVSEDSRPNTDEKFLIKLSTNRSYLPVDSRNLAYKAAQLMIKNFGHSAESGKFTININKNIPVAAGLAGGSSNCAAVIHGINKLWNLKLTLGQLCSLGSELGSDVPFCIMGQSAADDILKEDFKYDSLSCHCALASGTGTDLKPLKGLESYVVLSKPPISVSTAEVYKGIDSEDIAVRPDNEAMISAIKENNYKVVDKNMVNVLENFTLKRYPKVVYTKNKMSDLYNLGCSIMSGSGPTVFCLCQDAAKAENLCSEMLKINKESFWAETTR
ncbi:MAG: 4-(cytidine 5'-diphospho)-2-C-methyl-D-erythritol kinase [Anaerovoracaceae bacterium]